MGEGLEYWLRRSYEDYEDTLRREGITPMERDEWERHINTKDLSPSASAFLNSELEKIRSKKAFDELKGKGKTELESLISDIKGKKQGYLNTFQSSRADRRQKLLDILNKNSETQMSLDNPYILEDLSNRGLLHSSATGEALARERGNLETQVQSRMEMRDISDMDLADSLSQDIINTEFGLRKEGMSRINELDEASLSRGFSLDDLQSNALATSNIASKNAEIQQKQNEQQLLSDLIGFTGTVGGAALGNPLSLAGLFKRNRRYGSVTNNTPNSELIVE